MNSEPPNHLPELLPIEVLKHLGPEEAQEILVKQVLDLQKYVDQCLYEVGLIQEKVEEGILKERDSVA